MGHIRPESTNVFIKVLPKTGKDPLNPVSYRTILLIDIDQKLLTKIMAAPWWIPHRRALLKVDRPSEIYAKVLTVLDRVRQ